MENTIETTVILDHVKKTWRMLGSLTFYKELQILNQQSEISEIVSTQKINEQIFLFLSQNSQELFENHLLSLQTKKGKHKITDEEFNFLLNCVAEKFEINPDSILHVKTKKTPLAIVNCRIVFYYVLYKYYTLTIKEISELIFHSTAVVQRWITAYHKLHDKNKTDIFILNIHQEIIKTIKDKKNGTT